MGCMGLLYPMLWCWTMPWRGTSYPDRNLDHAHYICTKSGWRQSSFLSFDLNVSSSWKHATDPLKALPEAVVQAERGSGPFQEGLAGNKYG